MPLKIDQYAAAIITGGSSGIGAAFIELFARLNGRAWLGNLSRSEPPLLRSQPRLRHFPCDLRDRESIPGVVQQISQSIANDADKGPILLVNNSGFGAYGPFPEPELQRHLQMLEVNISAPVHLVGEFLQLLDERGGSIVNVASTAAFQPCPYLATYGATKAFLMNWSLALSHDLAPRGIQVLCVCPGPTKTNFFRAAGFETPPPQGGSGMTSEIVARQSLQALERGRRLVVNGWSNRFLAFASSKLPRTWAAAAAKQAIAQWRQQRDADS